MKQLILFSLLLGLFMTACKKDYYEDTGINDPHFDGSIMDFIDADPFYFDTLQRIIRYAGLEETLKTENVTFFAPPDPCFDKILKAVNEYQLGIGADSVTQFEQINPAVWKQFLSMYIFPGNRGLKDYSQVDTLALDTYKGALFESMNNNIMNIGVIFNDAVNGDIVMKYQGYRQLMISYVPDEAYPTSDWVNAQVATSDVAPNNGRVHILRYTNHIFGFDPIIFIQKATELGIAYPEN